MSPTAPAVSTYQYGDFLFVQEKPTLQNFAPEDLQLKGRPFLVDSEEPYFPERINASRDKNDLFLRVFHVLDKNTGEPPQLVDLPEAAEQEPLAEDAGRPNKNPPPKTAGKNESTNCWSPLAQATRSFLDAHLHRHGAAILRNLPLQNGQTFSDFLLQTGFALTEYVGGVTQRPQTAKMVYPASDEDPTVCMDLHQDNTYWPKPPAKLLFFYEKPAERGGLNPLLDMRKYQQKLAEELASDQELKSAVEKFESLGIRYENWYPDQGYDSSFVSWQRSFGTQEVAVVDM